jgi:hypothetical protein
MGFDNLPSDIEAQTQAADTTGRYGPLVLSFFAIADVLHRDQFCGPLVLEETLGSYFDVGPVMDGFAFRQELEKDPTLTKIPVVVVTADSQPKDKAKTLHVDALLKKPLDMNQLLETAARLSA